MTAVLRRIGLAVRLYRNTRRTFTGCSYRAHLVMAAKLLEIPSTTEGVVVECGSYLGGTTANLSIVCDIVGRDLIVYDSFEGLPPPRPGDRYAADVGTGFLRGDLERVRDNVARNGVVGFEPDQGVEFDPRAHSVGAIEITTEKGLDRIVAGVVKQGFRWDSGEVIRVAEVKAMFGIEKHYLEGLLGL